MAGGVSQLVALDHNALAKVAPNYEAMRTAIARCEKVDEISKLANQAVAAQAYFRQSQDVENEMHASRIRVRAERRLGEILKLMTASGQRANKGRAAEMSRGATLPEMGIPRDRASRAMQLADVPEDQFEAAIGGQKIAQPRKILADVRGPKKPALLVPINKTLALWGGVRDMGSAIESGAFPDIALWRENMQPFQVENLRHYIPLIIDYLTIVRKGIK